MTISPAPSRRSARLQQEDGFTLIEVLVALVVLVVGVLGTYIAFQSSQRLSLVSERHAAMAQIAQREIERLQGLDYAEIGLQCGGTGQPACPTPSTDPASPDYYLSSGGTKLQWDHATPTTAETVDVDSSHGLILPVQNWDQAANGGLLTGQIHDYVTWTTDNRCSPGCPSSQNYKRITVAVTITRTVNGQSQDLQPNPVFVSSVVADPQALPTGAVQNGENTLNPLNDPSTYCQTGVGTTGPCTAGIVNGTANTFFLHDWAATNSGSPTAPAADNPTHPTAGISTTGTCALTIATATQATEGACPKPDLMDPNAPPGNALTPLYNYSTDQCASPCTPAAPGGRELPPTCGTAPCTDGVGGGTGTIADCAVNAWSTGLVNNLNAFWVTPTLPAPMVLTGDGGLTLFTKTLNGAAETVSLCVEIYDVPPSGSAGSLADIEAVGTGTPPPSWQPVNLGGAAYVPPVDPTSGSNWPLAATQLSFVFNFRGSNGAVTVPAGDRIGMRVWMKANVNNPIDLIYDNPNYLSQLQLNSQ
jgi:type IV pilus assembly protein PilV